MWTCSESEWRTRRRLCSAPGAWGSGTAKRCAQIRWICVVIVGARTSGTSARTGSRVFRPRVKTAAGLSWKAESTEPSASTARSRRNGKPWRGHPWPIAEMAPGNTANLAGWGGWRGFHLSSNFKEDANTENQLCIILFDINAKIDKEGKRVEATASATGLKCSVQKTSLRQRHKRGKQRSADSKINQPIPIPPRLPGRKNRTSHLKCRVGYSDFSRNIKTKI